MNCKKLNWNRLWTILPAWLVVFTLTAQEGENLVPNGSFEQNSGKVRRLGQISAAEGWTSPTGVSADLFLASAKAPDIMVPENAFGKEDAKDGEVYAGIIAYSYNDKEKRTYITAKLSTPMKKDMRYKVVFYASLAELSKYASNRLGANFSKKEISTNDKVPALIDETHVQHPDEKILNGMYGWDMICGEYTAKGGERYINIGNFTANNDVESERVKKPREVKGTQIVAAYYYIDDVSVQLLGPNERCECGYADEAQVQTATIFTRRPVINEKMSPKQQIEEYNIYYRAERYDLTLDGDRDLTAIAQLMIAHPSLKVSINGHTDNFEYDKESTRDISLKRAEYIRSEMVNKGVDASRFTIADKQNNKPSPHIRESDDQQTASAKNRRVSFTVLD